jgi:exodeoxyribonuclease VII large subunit
MSQPSLFQSAHWSVSDLTRYLRRLLEGDEILQDVWVQGEISNLSRPSSGHMYFTLKDANASLRAVMWRGEAARLRLTLQDGMAVEAHGKIGVYEVGGQYQLYADLIQPVGEGALYQEFLRLKAMLEAEGLFDPERKRQPPVLPGRIGIITSPTGAALRDMLNTLRRRYPLAEVILSPAPVQGVEAPAAIVSALEALNRLGSLDVILLARGGGSIEDLWAFNDERVVRAVAASRSPIITGVGHETDFTLVDFAADLRAPTPTAAAELATPFTLADLESGVDAYASRLQATLTDRITGQRAELESLNAQMRFYSPLRRIQSDRQQLDDLARRSLSASLHRLSMEQSQVKGIQKRLEALNPLAVLSRGYAVVTKSADGQLISSVKQAGPGDELQVRVSDGEFDVSVTGEK